MVQSEIIQMYKELKRIYEKNMGEPDKVIIYDGQEFLIRFLKYHLEYLENRYQYLKGM